MQPAHRRHDISDTVWQILEPHLLGRKGTWGGMPATIANLSMLFSGFCAQARRDGIYRRITAIGITRIAVFPGGETRESGKSCWKH